MQPEKPETIEKDMNIQKILLSTIGAVAMTTTAVSTASAAAIDGTASASVVTAITLNEDRGLDFGTFTVGATGGDVTLTSVASTVRSADPDIGLLGTTEASGQFTITGTAGASVTIAIADGATNLSGPGADLVFTPDTTPSLGSPYIMGSGTDILYVGGTVTIAGSQAAGVYSSATAYTVTVNYE